MAFGGLLIIAAVGLVLDPLWSLQMVTWGVIAGTTFFAAIYIPQWFRLIGGGFVHPINYIFLGYALIGVAAGFRIY